MGLRRWWRGRSQAARFDLFVRASFYANFAAAPLLAAGSLRLDLSPTAAGVATLLYTGYVVVCLLLVRAGIGHYLGKRARPTALIVAVGTLTVVGAVTAYLLYPEPTPGQPDGPANLTMLILVVSFVAALSTTVRARVALSVAAVGCVATFALASAQHATDPVPPVVGLATLLVAVVLGSRATLWMLGLVWELDRSRQIQASLAVAEERLRFARDLHDVVGRTLSVVAIKAELAAQLAKRGREEAVAEMLEVRAIAQDSLAELRAVVGGFRSADLDAELAGARSLLASAGIESRIIGDGSDLPVEIQGALGWVVREGTTNVLRHSEATRCCISLGPASGEKVTLAIDNDAANAVPAGTDGRVRFGSGLIGLAERIAGLGGTLAAERKHPDLFQLTVELPLARADQAGQR